MYKIQEESRKSLREALRAVAAEYGGVQIDSMADATAGSVVLRYNSGTSSIHGDAAMEQFAFDAVGAFAALGDLGRDVGNDPNTPWYLGVTNGGVLGLYDSEDGSESINVDTSAAA